LQWWSLLKINFCEIFGVVQFSTFATLSPRKQTQLGNRGMSNVPGTEVATSFDHLGTSQAHASEIRNLQQLTVADPGSGKVGLGLAGCGAITA